MEYRDIKNPTRYYRRNYTRHSLRVPEYNCIESRQKRSEDLALRYAAEINRYNKAGGHVLFVSLTYNDTFLPRFEYVDEKTGEYFNIPCFDKSHKETFIKSIQDYLAIHCGYVCNVRKYDPNVFNFKYAWHSEFGKSEGSTHRPHYHLLLFFPPDVCKRIGDVLQTYKWIVNHFWKYGFVLWSRRPYNKFVDSEFASLYVSKYANKDLDFYSQPELDKFLYDENHQIIKERYDLIKPYLPIKGWSQHMGECLKDYYQTYEAHRDGVDFDWISDRTKGKKVLRKCPQYIQRKTIIDYDYQSERYILNDKGKEFKYRSFVENYPKKIMKLNQAITSEGISNKIDDVDVPALAEKYGFPASSIPQLAEYITSILYGRDIRIFYLYNSIWRGRTYSAFTQPLEYLGLFNEDVSVKDFEDISFQFYRNSLDQEIFDNYISEGVFTQDYYKSLKYYDDLPLFRDFNLVSAILSEIDFIYHRRCALIYEEIRENFRNAKRCLTG